MKPFCASQSLLADPIKEWPQPMKERVQAIGHWQPGIHWGLHLASRLLDLASRFVNPASRFAHPASRFAHPASRFVNPASRFVNPASRFVNPASRFAHPASRFAHPASRFVHPASRFNRLGKSFLLEINELAFGRDRMAGSALSCRASVSDAGPHPASPRRPATQPSLAGRRPAPWPPGFFQLPVSASPGLLFPCLLHPNPTPTPCLRC